MEASREGLMASRADMTALIFHLDECRETRMCTSILCQTWGIQSSTIDQIVDQFPKLTLEEEPCCALMHNVPNAHFRFVHILLQATDLIVVVCS